jgi:anhydro-N-acetylmuramic acid kinase
MDSIQQYKVIGIMSGTSLDGVDLAYCVFTKKDSWRFSISQAETIPYTKAWKTKLKEAHTLSAEKLLGLHVLYGKYLGALCKEFSRQHKFKRIDFVASHGHTIFHQPQNGFTFQLGDGNAMHSSCGFPVVYDFRSLDVMYGGQGAPLVPVGDKFLFSDSSACLNLGGIANISFEQKSKRIAFDICYVNMGLNYLAAKLGKQFDKSGELAKRGEINTSLLKKLEKVYSKTRTTRPSLGREFFEKRIQPLLDTETCSIPDRLRTFTEASAVEINHVFSVLPQNSSVLITGGGAFNSFLIYRLIELSADHVSLVIPDDEIVKFKEALVFAFLGVLRVEGENNCLKSVTGASQDSSSGIIAGTSKRKH